MATTVLLTACGSSCDQDGTPLTIVETSENPYEFFRQTTDLDIESARWKNRTTDQQGSASVYQDYGCIYPFGCGTLTHISASIWLVPGLNRVTFYEDDGDCEWKEDFEITLN